MAGRVAAHPPNPNKTPVDPMEEDTMEPLSSGKNLSHGRSSVVRGINLFVFVVARPVARPRYSSFLFLSSRGHPTLPLLSSFPSGCCSFPFNGRCSEPQKMEFASFFNEGKEDKNKKEKKRDEEEKRSKNVVLCGLNRDLGGGGEIIVELLTAN